MPRGGTRIGGPRDTCRAELESALPVLLPLAVAWAEAQEREIQRRGAPLPVGDIVLARAVGVAHPERVRVLSVPRIPGPEDPALKAACARLGFLDASTVGLTLGHGIFLRAGARASRRTLAHELRHVAQYVQHGSIASYLATYVPELLRHGYDAAPLERDACETAERCVGAEAR